ncbi:MAG TPA: helix-turn-helix domain-containing protein [Candidatus Limnocylindrales bacterium]|nr:helix-turn-helix domain-containing protein [Candidatus Limnocylindrales bacterium]
MAADEQEPAIVAPAAERTISDVETLKALSDPVRLRILETMIQAPDDAWTVKRIAAALGVGPTKLYHHIGILEEHAFIHPAGTRVVSGIIETRYRIAQLSVRLDRSLLAGGTTDENAAAVNDVIRSIFDTVSEDVSRAMRSGEMRLDAAGEPSRGILRQDLTRLSPARAEELRTRLTDLLNEFEGDADGEDDATAVPFGLLVALYPVTDTREEPTDD